MVLLFPSKFSGIFVGGNISKHSLENGVKTPEGDMELPSVIVDGDSYADPAGDAVSCGDIGGDDGWVSSSFTIGARKINKDYILTEIRIYVEGITGNPGVMTISLRAADGDHKPTGADLVVRTVAQADVTEIAWLAVDFRDSDFILKAGTQYCIVIRAAAAPGGATYELFYNSGTASAGEDIWVSLDSGATWPNNEDDEGMLTCEIYGIQVS